ncbi:uncharacterized protein LOC143881327 isoform X2 [Tasmannia lanceolata]|uniref:uncharacterized protein LOC143881327 isoform X2 n=1 Tax=Tasmannia lanceolata TaxID=3420 RepID=UPI0040645D4B
MEESWRFRPLQGNICPTCSISHFPFCSQSALFDRTGLVNHHTFHGPFHDPFLDNRAHNRPNLGISNPPLDPYLNRPNLGVSNPPLDLYPNRPNLGIPNPPLDPYPNPPLDPYPNPPLDPYPFRRSSQPLQTVDSRASNGIHRDGFQPARFKYGSGGFHGEEFVENERFLKRTKVDEMAFGSLTQVPPPIRNDHRISADNERILNLIRDHGGRSVRLPQVGMDLSVDSRPSFARMGFVGGNQWNVDNVRNSAYDYQTDRYSHEMSIQERRFDSIEARDRANFEEQSTIGTDHVGFGSVVRNGLVLHSEAAFREKNHSVQVNVYDDYRNFTTSHSSQSIDRLIPHERNEFHKGDYSLGFGQQLLQTNSNGFQPGMDYASRNKEESSKGAFVNSQDEQHRHAYYGHTDMPLHHLEGYRHRSIATSALNYVDSARQGQGLDASHEEDHDQQKMNWGEQSSLMSEQGYPNQRQQISNCTLDHTSDGYHETYHAYDRQQLQPKECSSSILPKQPKYPITATSQVPLALDVQGHERSSSYLPTENFPPVTQLPQQVYTMQHPVENKHRHHGQHGDITSYRPNAPLSEGIQKPIESQPVIELSGARNASKQEGYSLMPAGFNMASTTLGQVQASQASVIHPPLPPLPVKPLPVDTSGPSISHLQATSSPLTASSPLCNVPISSSATVPLSLPPTIQPFPEVHLPSKHSYFYNKPLPLSLTGFATEGSQFSHQRPDTLHLEEGQPFPLKHPLEKPKVIDAVDLFRQPHRATRPDHIVIILRGLPGSGKSYLAKTLRDLEVENGGSAPRIHSMDDYFMTEVEKVEENEGSKSSSSVKGKKRITRKVMEYCYEPEMEEAYRSSMLKAFKKTLEEGNFTFIIVDDRNLRVADFAQFWAIAKRSGYEVYLLEAAYKDPMGCAARNVHGFSSDDIQKMADQWEQAPPLYLQLNIQVDMDMEDMASNEDGLYVMEDGKAIKAIEPPSEDDVPDGLLKVGERWDTEREDPSQGVKELGRSKWSEDVDEDVDRAEGSTGDLNALSGLIQAYGKGNKSVHWGDRVGKSGFSIGAVKKSNVSLIIGSGSGYNLDSNPLPIEDAIESSNSSMPKSRTTFLEHLRAERESFKAVFDRRRQRIGGLEMENE